MTQELSALPTLKIKTDVVVVDKEEGVVAEAAEVAEVEVAMLT